MPRPTIAAGKSGVLPWTTQSHRARSRALAKALPGAALRSAGSLVSGAAGAILGAAQSCCVIFDSTTGIVTATQDFYTRSWLLDWCNSVQANSPSQGPSWETYWPYTVNSPLYVGEGGDPLPVDGLSWWQHLIYFENVNGRFDSFGFEWPNHFRMNLTRFVNFCLEVQTYPEVIEVGANAGLVFVLSVGGPGYTLRQHRLAAVNDVEIEAGTHLLILGYAGDRTREESFHRHVAAIRPAATSEACCLVVDKRASAVAGLELSAALETPSPDFWDFPGAARADVMRGWWQGFVNQTEFLESGAVPSWFDGEECYGGPVPTLPELADVLTDESGNTLTDENLEPLTA